MPATPLTQSDQTTGGLAEIPTVILAVVIYGGWLLVTSMHDRLPLPVVAIVGSWFVAWHGSLQHETIHGHPTRSARINGLIGGIPLGLWLPYSCYRRLHVAHHDSPAITDPLLDPESRYLPAARTVTGKVRHLAASIQATLIGRVMIGPVIEVIAFAISELARAYRAPAEAAIDWLPHIAGAAIVIAWLRWCGFDLTSYVVLVVYPSIGLTLVRSFAEHRSAPAADHRVAVVESRGPLALLFLHNNLHAAHHRAPGVPWYALPAFHRRHRAAILRANGGLVYRNYREIFRRFAWHPHDTIVHPEHVRRVRQP